MKNTIWIVVVMLSLTMIPMVEGDYDKESSPIVPQYDRKGKYNLAESWSSVIGSSMNTYSGDYNNRGAGDLNGDGFDDIIIGAYGYDTKENPDCGIVYFILGNNTGWKGKIFLGPEQYSFISSSPVYA